MGDSESVIWDKQSTVLPNGTSPHRHPWQLVKSSSYQPAFQRQGPGSGCQVLTLHLYESTSRCEACSSHSSRLCRDLAGREEYRCLPIPPLLSVHPHCAGWSALCQSHMCPRHPGCFHRQMLEVMRNQVAPCVSGPLLRRPRPRRRWEPLQKVQTLPWAGFLALPYARLPQGSRRLACHSALPRSGCKVRAGERSYLLALSGLVSLLGLHCCNLFGFLFPPAFLELAGLKLAASSASSHGLMLRLLRAATAGNCKYHCPPTLNGCVLCLLQLPHAHQRQVPGIYCSQDNRIQAHRTDVTLLASNSTWMEVAPGRQVPHGL